MVKSKTGNELMVKVCGITDRDNALAVSACKPNLMGFILYPASKRYISFCDAQDIISTLPTAVKKVAVLVNEDLAVALEIADSLVFDYIQLHGDETADYCKRLSESIPVIKAFGVEDHIPSNLDEYEECCTYFLFDTKSKSYGGTGKQFNHQALEAYNYDIPFFLSGGIGTEDAAAVVSYDIKGFAGIDANSKLEVAPGIKDIEKVENLIKQVRKCTKK